VVHEPFAASGALAARVIGVPAILHEISLWDPHEIHAATSGSRAFRRTLHRYRVEQVAPATTLTITPPSLVGERDGHRVRAIPSSSHGELPDWLAGPGDRPRVLVSRSTAHSGPGGDPTRSIIAAAPHVDADFVLVRGRQRRPLPSNVHVTGWLPLDRALARAAAFVHHGGAGGLLQALAAGVPQLTVPGIADRRFNAEVIARSGAGLSVEARHITPDVLRRLLGDAALRRAAERLRTEIRDLPDPASLVALIERTAG
jgi:UDP:flavonoid glycosyltransferase YjiC (YdhE family)